jgi:hypothetical protein
MPQSRSYDDAQAIKTIREVLEYNPYIAPELIVMEIQQRGYVVDPVWLHEQIEREQQREKHIPIILAAYVPTRSVKCSDCYINNKTVTPADFIVLLDVSPDWKAVCDSCSNTYEWNDETEFSAS